MEFLMTFDVEDFSIPLNTCDQETAKMVYKVGLPRILSLLSKHDIKGTFYFTGQICENIPESVHIVKDHGHEIGCHGYSHSIESALDILSYENQLKDIMKAKKIIESVAGRIESFRSPALRINENTIRALEKTGFTSDSSVCSQRFDGPFTFGSRRKLKWLFAPRNPYFLSYESIANRGNSKILEIPISAFLFSFSGTTMRRSAFINGLLEKILYLESRKTGKPVVFLFHPNECLETPKNFVRVRRSSNTLEYFFAEVVRHKLKLKNLGINSIYLLDRLLKNAKKNNFEFITARKYVKSHRTRTCENGNC